MGALGIAAASFLRSH